MSKYIELAELACDQSERTFAEKAKCKDFAERIVFGYQRYLTVPDKHFSIVQVGQDLEAVKPSGNDFRIHLTRRDDGLWWFGFYVYYGIEGRNTFLEEITKIGVAPEGSRFRVRTSEDAIIDPASEEDLQKFFQSLYDTRRSDFGSNHASPKTRIGFIKNA